MARKLTHPLAAVAAALTPALCPRAAAQDSPAGDAPVRYVGELQPDKTRYDGRIPHAIGVHSRQVFRANRTRPPGGGLLGYTYNHQPYLAHWHGRFHLQFLGSPHGEHLPPTHTSIITSDDGLHWSAPRVLFPVYELPQFTYRGRVVPGGLGTIMHQRMGFYVAPNGRLLALGFYGYVLPQGTMPNPDHAIARVVREIHDDGSFGPIHVIRHAVRDTGFTSRNVRWPSFRTSTDPGFVAACEALLADKLYTLQWWEENRGDDGFFAITPEQMGKGGRALSWFTRADGQVVALWKNGYCALSSDQGRSWSAITRAQSLRDPSAKIWGQRTADGRYALVYDHSANRNSRFPLVAVTSDDGVQFDNMLCLQGEVPPMRYVGAYKNAGPQYVRGITPGNGDPPGEFLWVTYSMNKEDMWVSRARLPLSGREIGAVDEDFEGPHALDRWNLYVPQWAPVDVASEPPGSNHVLELRDADPADYACAERLFPESSGRVVLRLRLQCRQLSHDGALALEVQSQRSERPVQLYLTDNWLYAVNHQRRSNPHELPNGRWVSLEIAIDCAAQTYSAAVDGAAIQSNLPFNEPASNVARLVLRTGPWRGIPPVETWDHGAVVPFLFDSQDMPGVDIPADPAVFWIDDLSIR